MASSLPNRMQSTDSQHTDVNILLLGETGVGKSTFINSFANYMEYSTLNKALESKLLCLIPTKFTIPDENFLDRFIEIGSDINEDIEIGNSSTQGARAYVFTLNGRKIRIIDTPGIGDARGIDQDKKNFENVLAYISQFEDLHAICFLLKPNVSVINAYFKFCILHLLSRLERSAANNIIFIYTNSRSTFYRPGETLPVLKKILDEIKQTPPHVTIPCSKGNMFCMDNEPFKFLVALKNGIKFGDREKNDFGTSWETSYQTCKELLAHICGENNLIKPHKIRNTLSVNEARRNIIDLSKPLADISDLIHDNLIVLTRHQHSITEERLSTSELRAKLYVPAIELEGTKLQQPVTVCTASKCSEIYTCEGLNKYHYKQRCHNPCHLRNVPQEIIGSPELRHCAAIGSEGICKKCGCDFSAHMHIYYETKVHHIRREDETIKTKLNTAQDVSAAKSKMINKLTSICNEYELEKHAISKTMAKFAHFLQENSIATYNDAYIDYIDYLIERENMLGYNKNVETIMHYRELKKLYEYEKRALDDAMRESKKYNSNAVIITTEDIFTAVKSLYNLRHTGHKIKELHESQQHLRDQENCSMEYHHQKSPEVSENESDSEDHDNCAILKVLLQEENLEAIRLKLRGMNLPGPDEDERKQKIWNVLKDFYKQPENNEAEKSQPAPQRNTTGTNKKQGMNRNPDNGFNRNSNKRNEQNRNSNRNQQSNEHNDYNQSRGYPPRFNYPNQHPSFPHQNQSYSNQNPPYPNHSQYPQFQNYSTDPYQDNQYTHDFNPYPPNYNPNQSQHYQNPPRNPQHFSFQPKQFVPNRFDNNGKPKNQFKKKFGNKHRNSDADDQESSDSEYVNVRKSNLPQSLQTPNKDKIALMADFLEKFKKELLLKKEKK